LIRALQQDGRARILSRPQVMTLDNLPAFVQSGEQVPYSGGQTIGTGGQASVNTLFANVGLILGVTPRVTPDGLIVMEVDTENSVVTDFVDVGPGAQAPRIDLSRAQTTVAARNGQTVILGGIITNSQDFTSRRIPYLSDIPVLGQLFRFDSQVEIRTELLIVLTPFVVNNEYDMERVKQVEFARMNWCLADVVAIHGDVGGQSGAVLSDCDVIFPDQDPLGVQIAPVPDPQYGLPDGVDATLPPPGAGQGMLPPAPGMTPPGYGPAPVLPRTVPPGAVPTPALPSPDLPLTPPVPMGARPPGDGVRESSRRREMENVYYPSGQPFAGQNYPVYPAAYQK
jgi:hypothetical protein